MNKYIKYTAANMCDIRNLRGRIHCEIEELLLQHRIIDAKLETLMDVRDALDGHIASIERLNEEEDKNE